MVSLATTLTTTEVRNFLTEDGYEFGTAAFRTEMDRRYIEVAEGVFEEHDDWKGDRRRVGET